MTALPGYAPSPHSIDVDLLREAIYNISIRHDWEHTLDTEDRTEEIVREYERLRTGSPEQ